MQKVTEETNLVVGKFYLVECAVIVNNLGNFVKNVPVIGIPHADSQFGVPEKHYHVDGRFNSEDINSEGKTNAIMFLERRDEYHYVVKETKFMKRKCMRLTTGLNVPDKPLSNKYHAWYEQQIGKSCAGKRCPHLGTFMHECNGHLVCPLHNLIGDLKTEKIIPYGSQYEN